VQGAAWVPKPAEGSATTLTATALTPARLVVPSSEGPPVLPAPLEEAPGDAGPALAEEGRSRPPGGALAASLRRARPVLLAVVGAAVAGGAFAAWRASPGAGAAPARTGAALVAIAVAAKVRLAVSKVEPPAVAREPVGAAGSSAGIPAEDPPATPATASPLTTGRRNPGAGPPQLAPSPYEPKR
jgi:hypothetical protein